MRGGYRLSGWGGLGWVWVWGGYGCVWIGREWARSETPLGAWGAYPPGSLREIGEIWAQGQETGATVAWASGVGFFFLCLFFPCPVRDEAMGTSPEEGVRDLADQPDLTRTKPPT